MTATETLMYPNVNKDSIATHTQWVATPRLGDTCHWGYVAQTTDPVGSRLHHGGNEYYGGKMRSTKKRLAAVVFCGLAMLGTLGGFADTAEAESGCTYCHERKDLPPPPPPPPPADPEDKPGCGTTKQCPTSRIVGFDSTFGLDTQLGR